MFGFIANRILDGVGVGCNLVERTYVKEGLKQSKVNVYDTQKKLE